MEDSSCRSLCSPSPLAARCSRMTAMSRLLPSLAAQRGRQAVAQPAGRVGDRAHPAEQVLPLAARQAAAFDVGAGELAPLVEELRVLRLQRRDLGLDEGVHPLKQRRQVVWQVEVHVVPPPVRIVLSAASRRPAPRWWPPRRAPARRRTARPSRRPRRARCSRSARAWPTGPRPSSPGRRRGSSPAPAPPGPRRRSGGSPRRAARASGHGTWPSTMAAWKMPISSPRRLA